MEVVCGILLTVGSEVQPSGAPGPRERENGEPEALAWSSSPLPWTVWLGGAGLSIGILAIALSLRARARWRQQIEQLHTAIQAAEAENRASAELLATLSHEVRTALGGMIGMETLLLETPLDRPQRDWAEAIRASSEALLAMVDEILEGSRIEAGEVPPKPISLNLRRVVEEVAGLFRPLAVQKGLQLVCDVDPQIPAWLVGDPIRIRQVLTNLASNAVKFTSQGEVRLEARLMGQTGDRSAVRIAVIDTGIGIAPKDQQRIFERFTRVETGGGPQRPGAGLGLTISRQLASQIGGTIHLQSEPGKGSTFWFDIELPRGEAPTSENTGADLSTIGSPPILTPGIHPAFASEPLRAPLRVLLAEDDEINRRVTLSMVERLGCQAEAVSSGREVIEATARIPFDLILMDIQIPEMDGYRATTEIRRREATTGGHIPIIALTARAMKQDRERCLEAGMDDYLTKPIQPGALREVLIRWGTQKPGREAGSASQRRPGASLPLFFNPAVLASSCNSDRDLMRDVLNLSLQRIPERLKNIRVAIDAGNPHSVAQEAHSLKGIFLTLGAEDLAATCQDLIAGGEQGQEETLISTLSQLRNQWAQAQREMESYQQSLTPPAEGSQEPGTPLT